MSYKKQAEEKSFLDLTHEEICKGALNAFSQMYFENDLKLFFEFLKKSTPNSTISNLNFERKFQEFKELLNQ